MNVSFLDDLKIKCKLDLSTAFDKGVAFREEGDIEIFITLFPEVF